jgi:hypothetical protein
MQIKSCMHVYKRIEMDNRFDMKVNGYCRNLNLNPVGSVGGPKPDKRYLHFLLI